ncbi:hypothetical protein L6164_012025 [Bauhinia variegata]|uniref:Uncharacterized protein n=1 Tax=Bauhinia variegata TaxID=167791 RepID=A0ACB9P8R0_BAUVA|nr:hypothetical protein L6164_012025 [Bauhinia variegata]
MADRKNDHEFDELEKLLGEIPNATSTRPHCEESGPKNLLHDRSIPHLSINSCKGPFIGKLQKSGDLVEGKFSRHNIPKSPFSRLQPSETIVPGDQSLPSAFSDLRLNNIGTVEAQVPLTDFKLLESHKTHNMSLDFQYPNSSTKVAPPFYSPVILPFDFDDFNSVRAGEHTSNLLKFGVDELKKQSSGYWEPVDPSFNVPVLGRQYSVMPSQQQFFLDVQSSLLYLHPQQNGQSQINWRKIEEEKYHWLQQNLYQQQLHAQKLEAPQPMQANGTIPPRQMFSNQRQPPFGVPIPHQLEKSRGEQLYDNYMTLRDSNISYSPLSSVDYNSVHVLDEAEKQFPEKILTRSQGLDMFKTVKFGSFGQTELQNRVGQTGKVFPNGYSCTPSAKGLHNFRPNGLTSDGKEFRKSNQKQVPQKHTSVDEVKGRIYLMAKDQHDCRFLQRKFEEGTPEDIDKIFLEIIDYTAELMIDPFGNYLIQKLLEVCDEDKKMQILHAICKPGEFIRISCDMHGTRAIQKVIETLKKPEQFSMVVSSLKPGIVTLMKNINGNHVAQRCLQYLIPEYKEFLFEASTKNCVEIATDRHGCCVLQKCLSHSDGEQRQRLVCEITSNSLLLSQDQFGNYVVQFVLDLQLPWATIDILEQLEGNFCNLSIQKHSSNVVERCLKYASEEHQILIIQELIQNPELDQIMLDPYGNYVIQAAIKQSKGSLNAALMNAIRPHVPVLRTSPYGKKILSNNLLDI